jgi:tetratricopeptide (TPR) repeat protein
MKDSLDFSPLEVRVLRGCRIFLMVTGVLALFTGVFALVLKPVLPRAWSGACVPFGIAELVYAAVVLMALAVMGALWPRSTAVESHPEEKDGKKDGAGAGKGAGETPEKASGSPDFETVVGFVTKLFGALLALGIVGIGLYVSGAAASPLVAPFWFDFGRLAGTGLLAALGFFAAGTLFGFLFGLPKSGQNTKTQIKADPKTVKQNNQKALGTDPNATIPSGSDSRADGETEHGAVPDDNTNLEEVSDWLTKIIVGVGLVELKQIPHGIRQLTDFFIKECGNELCGGLFVMMGIFFLIIGFISAYVLARFYLKLAIVLVNRLVDSPAQKTAREAKATADKSWVVALVNEMRDLISINKSSKVGLEYALNTINQALQESPDYPVALVQKARALRWLSVVKNDRQLLEQALAVVNRARQVTEDKYAPAVYNAACYKALLEEPLANFIDDLKKAFDLNPGLKEEARTDADLARVRDLPEFKALLQ